VIKQIAIYLRKSRDKKEDDDVLSKHRDTLVELCQSQKWNYTIYEEIASGERLAYRPVIQDMLEAVEEGAYDAVLVMDIDRLGRGNNKDWGVIYESFCHDQHNTLIVTPQKTYDLTVDADEMMVDFQSLIAKVEYKTIKRRFKQGKIGGAKQGKWVCGNPPYPYLRNSKKTLEVDNEKLHTYRLMVNKAVAGESIEDITLFLNQNHIAAPKGGLWSSRSILRLLTSEIHLGYMIYGKTKGDTRKNNFAKINKSDWIKVEAEHEPVKNLEEHQEILRQISSRRSIPVAARAKKHMLSGVLYCEQCGYRMHFKWSSSSYYVAICSHKFPDGGRCSQIGYKLELLNQLVSKDLFTLDPERLNYLIEESKQQQDNLVLIEQCKQELPKIDAALDKIYDAYEDGTITKQKFAERKNKKEQQKQELLDKITELESHVVNVIDVDKYMNVFNQLKDTWENEPIDEATRNQIIHLLVSKIVYNRINKNDEPEISIIYKHN
jgi:DNA invertase Pin-like site-specific DNA recombinase/putative hemolysin